MSDYLYPKFSFFLFFFFFITLRVSISIFRKSPDLVSMKSPFLLEGMNFVHVWLSNPKQTVQDKDNITQFWRALFYVSHYKLRNRRLRILSLKYWVTCMALFGKYQTVFDCYLLSISSIQLAEWAVEWKISSNILSNVHFISLDC